LGAVKNLTDTANRFAADNDNLTAMMLGHPSDISVNGNPVSGKEKVINYIRGADVLDEDADTDVDENMRTRMSMKTGRLSPVMSFTASHWSLPMSMPTTAPRPWFSLGPTTACCMRFWMTSIRMWTFPVTKSTMAEKPGPLFHRISSIA
jgi:hypothetical protein